MASSRDAASTPSPTLYTDVPNGSDTGTDLTDVDSTWEGVERSIDGKQTIEVKKHFSSKIGLILSCLGCVVGTGNIWRFPRIIANNSYDEGGLVFLIVWALFLFTWSVPMLTIEYATGRYTQQALVGSFRQLVGPRALWMGAWICMVSFMISCYYAVVLGWCFYYFVHCISHQLPDSQEKSKQVFQDFAQDSLWPLLTTGVAVILAGLSVSRGVKTIEKVSMCLVPLLLFIILFTFVWALTLRAADTGIIYMFTPNWESLKKPRLWIDALSQNAFDTGAGIGLMVPYSSYMTRQHGIVKYSTLIPAANNMVSLVSGITIFSAVFSTLTTSRPEYSKADIINVLKDSGPGSTGLTFIWLPVLFETVGVFGRVLACLFFLCLSFAGLTSLIADVELITHTLADFGLRRALAVPLCVVCIFGIALMSALNIDILTNQDFVWGFALVVNGLLFIFMVVYVGTSKFREDLINGYSLDDWVLSKTWEYVIKFLAPLEAVALIAWWAVDLISNGAPTGELWYEFGKETLISTLVQWFGLFLVLITINMIFVYCVLRRWTNEEERPFLYESQRASQSQEHEYTKNKTLEIRL